MLLGANGQLSFTGRQRPSPAPAVCPCPWESMGHEDDTPNQPLGEGTAEHGWARPPHKGAAAPVTHLRPILGVKGGVGFSRDLWRERQPSAPVPRPALPWGAEPVPTWWRGWRLRTRPTGGAGRPLRQRPCPRRCGSGERSPPSGSASAPPGLSGSLSGPGEPLSASWGVGERPSHPVASAARHEGASTVPTVPTCRQGPQHPASPKRQSLLDGRRFL